MLTASEKDIYLKYNSGRAKKFSSLLSMLSHPALRRSTSICVLGHAATSVDIMVSMPAAELAVLPGSCLMGQGGASPLQAGLVPGCSPACLLPSKLYVSMPSPQSHLAFLVLQNWQFKTYTRDLIFKATLPPHRDFLRTLTTFKSKGI